MVFRKGYKRRNKKAKKGNKLATRAYVKRIAGSQSEIKKADMASSAFFMKANAPYIFNPTYQLQQGTASNQRIGRVVQNVGLRLSLQYSHLGTNSLGALLYSSSVFRLLVLSSAAVKQGVAAPNTWQFPTVDMAPLDIFYRSTDLGTAHVNKSRWTVLKDMSITAHQVTDNALAFTTGTTWKKNFYIPIHKRCTFRSLAANSVLSEKEVYIVIVASGPGMSLTDNAGLIVTEGLLEYRDE